MTEPTYIQIEAEGKDDESVEPFRFILAGKKFDVPKLGPNTVPAGLFAAAAREFSSDIDKIGAFLYELFEWRPDIGKELKKLPMQYATEFIKQWTEFSNLDPKAPTSSS